MRTIWVSSIWGHTSFILFLFWFRNENRLIWFILRKNWQLDEHAI